MTKTNRTITIHNSLKWNATLQLNTICSWGTLFTWSKSFNFPHHLSFVSFKLFILCTITTNMWSLETDNWYHKSSWTIKRWHNLPLSSLKSSNSLRILLLFATNILTMSAGLCWLAANSCYDKQISINTWWRSIHLCSEKQTLPNVCYNVILVPWKHEMLQFVCSCLTPVEWNQHRPIKCHFKHISKF